MSDNMEREKNQSMGAKEIEEEEEQMQRQLEDLGIYETGYSYIYMKKILGFISDSKVMANMANDNKNTQKELYSSSDSTLEPRPSLAQDLEIEEHIDSPKPIHSYKHNHTSPVFDKVQAQSSNSPESMSTFETTYSEALDKLHDSSIRRDSSPHGSNKYILSSSKKSFQESHNTRTADMKIINQKMERWRINPLNCFVSENDVPLQEPKRPVAQERQLLRLCKEAQTPEMLEKLLPALNAHLKEIQELWHSWQHTTNIKFRWGSPIQVGTANGSLDKSPLTNVQCSQNITDCTGKYTQDRINKRKSTLLVSPPDTRHFSDDEDEEMKFITTKRKKTHHDKHEPSNKVLRSYKNILLEEDITSPNRSNTNKDSTTNVEEWPDNLNANDLQICLDQSSERLSPTLVPKYPRRVVPPNPSTKNVTVPRKRKCDTNMVSKNRLSLNIVEEKQNTVGRFRKKNNTLSDHDISLELEGKDEDSEVKVEKKDVEIKPLKLLNLQVRLEKQCMLLKKEQFEKQRKKEAEAREARKKEEEKRRKKEENLKKQEEEAQRKNRQREETEKKQMENSTKWNNVLKFKEQKEKARVLRRQEQIRLSETDEENRLLQDNDISVTRQFEATNNSSTNSVPCPICNKSFPKDEIQAHAAGCEQFVIDDDDDDDDAVSYESIVQSKSDTRKKSISDAGLLECAICSKYKTTNGIEYEDHVNSCIQRQYEPHRTRSYGQTIDVDNIPTSPVRCYRPISQQTDSEIDYRAQFPSNSRSHSNQSRKRKR